MSRILSGCNTTRSALKVCAVRCCEVPDSWDQIRGVLESLSLFGVAAAAVSLAIAALLVAIDEAIMRGLW